MTRNSDPHRIRTGEKTSASKSSSYAPAHHLAQPLRYPSLSDRHVEKMNTILETKSGQQTPSLYSAKSMTKRCISTARLPRPNAYALSATSTGGTRSPIPCAAAQTDGGTSNCHFLTVITHTSFLWMAC